MSRMASDFSVAGPSPKLNPMQPRPSAETSRPLFPSVRFCIISPVRFGAGHSNSSAPTKIDANLGRECLRSDLRSLISADHPKLVLSLSYEVGIGMATGKNLNDFMADGRD